MISVVHDRCLYIGGESSRQFSDFLRRRARENFGRNSRYLRIPGNRLYLRMRGRKGADPRAPQRQKRKSLTLQKFRPDFTTDLKESWILCHSVEFQNHAKTDSARPWTARRHTPPVFLFAPPALTRFCARLTTHPTSEHSTTTQPGNLYWKLHQNLLLYCHYSIIKWYCIYTR